MIDPGAPPLRILLVVDSEPTIASIAIPLTQAGHALAMVQTAREVFKQIEAQPWDAVIIDLTTIEAGLDLARQIRERQVDLSLILLTDQPADELLETGFKLGVYDWLFKPPLLTLVLAALDRASERRSLRKQAQENAAAATERNDTRHEINNQLAGIIGLVQLHLTGPGLDGEVEQDLRLVLDHAKRLRDLLRAKR
ncbi:MAG TPA: response regulator [Herpetosiphonaceae bacterium]